MTENDSEGERYGKQFFFQDPDPPDPNPLPNNPNPPHSSPSSSFLFSNNNNRRERPFRNPLFSHNHSYKDHEEEEEGEESNTGQLSNLLTYMMNDKNNELWDNDSPKLSKLDSLVERLTDYAKNAAEKFHEENYPNEREEEEEEEEEERQQQQRQRHEEFKMPRNEKFDYSSSGEEIEDVDYRLRLPLDHQSESVVHALSGNNNHHQNGGDENVINVVFNPNREDDVQIYPAEELDRIKRNLTDQTGLSIDKLVNALSENMDGIRQPTDVQEFHTQVTHTQGQRPTVVHEETVAKIHPQQSPQQQPRVDIISSDVKKGFLGDTQDFLDGDEIGGGGGVGVGGGGKNVNVNVTTKTNVVNIFTFNIFIHNSTSGEYETEQGVPYKTKIETTAEVDQSPLQQVLSTYHYQANAGHQHHHHQPGPQRPQRVRGPEVTRKKDEALLAYLLRAQYQGSKPQEAVLHAHGALLPRRGQNAQGIMSHQSLMDTFITQNHEVYEYDDEVDDGEDDLVDDASSSIGPLGYTLPPENASPTMAPEMKQHILNQLGFASFNQNNNNNNHRHHPYFMPLMNQRRRRKRSTSDESIPKHWLLYLLGKRNATEFGQFGRPEKFVFTETPPTGTATTPTTTTTTTTTMRTTSTTTTTVSTTTTATTATTTTTTMTMTHENKPNDGLLSYWSSIFAKHKNVNPTTMKFLTDSTPSNSFIIKQQPAEGHTLRPLWSLGQPALSVPNNNNNPSSGLFDFIQSTTTSTTTATTTTTASTTTTKASTTTTSTTTTTKASTTTANLFTFLNSHQPWVSKRPSFEYPAQSRTNEPEPESRTNDEEADDGNWLTAEDVIPSLKSPAMTNSPIVIIPVEAGGGRKPLPEVKLNILKTHTKNNPITLVNLKSESDELEQDDDEKTQNYLNFFLSKFSPETTTPKILTTSFVVRDKVEPERPQSLHQPFPPPSRLPQLDSINAMAPTATPEPVNVTSNSVQTFWSEDVISKVLERNSNLLNMLKRYKPTEKWQFKPEKDKDENDNRIKIEDIVKTTQKPQEQQQHSIFTHVRPDNDQFLNLIKLLEQKIEGSSQSQEDSSSSSSEEEEEQEQDFVLNPPVKLFNLGY